MKTILKSQDDFKNYANNSPDKNHINNSPEEYPCMIIRDYYKVRHETGLLERFCEFLYRKDISDLIALQIEDKINV